MVHSMFVLAIDLRDTTWRKAKMPFASIFILLTQDGCPKLPCRWTRECCDYVQSAARQCHRASPETWLGRGLGGILAPGYTRDFQRRVTDSIWGLHGRARNGREPVPAVLGDTMGQS